MNYLDKLRCPRISPIVFIVLGGILLLWPDAGSAAVSAVLGWILVALGALGLVIGFFTWRTFGVGLSIASVAALFGGIWLNNNPLALARILGVAFGAMLLAQGMSSLKDARRVRSAGGFYRFSQIVGIVTVVLGGFLILSPLSTSRFVMTVTGIILICCGISNLVSQKRAERCISEYSTIIDTE